MTEPVKPPNGAARWQLWVSIGSPLLAVIGALFMLYGTIQAQGFRTELALSKLATVEERLREHERNQATDRLDITNLNASLREVERQFCGESQLRNLTLANQMRINATLWEGAKLGRFATDNAYYPALGCETKQQDVKR